MTENNFSLHKPDEDLLGLSFDEIDNLYIGGIEAAGGVIQTDARPYQAQFWGEILLYGHPGEQGFIVDGLRRIALVGRLEDPADDPRVRGVSLAGPLEPRSLPLESVEIADIPLQLHYAALSELEPRLGSSHARYPQVEVILADLNWKQTSPLGPDGIDLAVDLTAGKLVDSKLGIITSLSLTSLTLHFVLAGSGGPRPEPKFTLQSNCSTPAGPNRPSKRTLTRLLKVKFINFTGLPDIDSICNEQIGGVCQVWRTKAALDLEVVKPVVSGIQPEFRNPDSAQETSIHSLGYDDPDCLEIYVVESMVNDRGGGYTPDALTGASYCIIDVSSLVANPNPNLLAHELGHALGLAHPDGFQGILPGSSGSVMEPLIPDLVENTLYNCRMFKCSNPPLLPLVCTTATIDYLRPDSDFYIRDFPADPGSEPTALPPGQNFWSQSNLWNRRANNPGGVNAAGGPQHEEPQTTDAQNHLFVRLGWTNVNLQDPVDVDLYAAPPGISTSRTPLIPLSPGNPIHFPPGAQPEYVQSQAWSPAAMAAVLPPHSDFFAVARPPDDCPVYPPAPAATFGNTGWRVLVSNKIARRSVYYLSSAAPAGSPQPIMMPWVEMGNPSSEPAAAQVEIDTAYAGDLQELFLEVDGQERYDLQAGELSRVLLDEQLPAEITRIIRLGVTLPAGAAEGAEYPIDLRFYIAGQLAGGFTHVVRIQPMAAALGQVLGWLSGALLAVAEGCQAPQAGHLAERVHGALAEFSSNPESGLVYLAGLSGEMADLGHLIDPIGSGERREVQRRLVQLAGLLQGGGPTSIRRRIERLRASIDYIYEPASRLARARLM